MRSHVICAMLVAMAMIVPTRTFAKHNQSTTHTTQGKPMKILISYYSRTGTTKQACDELAAKLGADVEPVIDTKSRSGIWGYIMGGRDAVQKHTTVIGPLKFDPAQYDLVVVASPA